MIRNLESPDRGATNLNAALVSAQISVPELVNRSGNPAQRLSCLQIRVWRDRRLQRLRLGPPSYGGTAVASRCLGTRKKAADLRDRSLSRGEVPQRLRNIHRDRPHTSPRLINASGEYGTYHF